MKQIKEIWLYRQMIASLVKKDLRTRYKASVLGFFWTFLNPLLQLLVYSFVFAQVMRIPTANYSMFLFVALVPWIFLSASLNGGAMSIIGSKNLIQKIYFPRIILPISNVCSNFMNMLFSFIVVFIALFATGIGVCAYLWVLPIIMIIEFVFVLGLTLIVSCLNVYFRDIEQIVVIGTLAWQFLSPVMYEVSMVPEGMRSIFYLNPMTSIIVAYRNILYDKVMPDMSTLFLAIVLSIVFLITGYLLFQRLQRGFAEEL